MINTPYASANRVKKQSSPDLISFPVASIGRLHDPDQGAACEKCSRARATPMRTRTLAIKPTTKQNPAAYRIERSPRSKIPGGLSLCIAKVWRVAAGVQAQEMPLASLGARISN